MQKKFLDETLPSGLEKLEKILDGKKWFVGDKVSILVISIVSTSCEYIWEHPWYSGSA